MPFDKYNLGCYLLDRLVEVGCEHMFGVPGDYNLRFLDDVMTHSIKWVGCANELNAAYAADGYARRRGIAALATTCGVGELSATNGIAGSAAESVPVLHIAGAPSMKSIAGHEKIHHTLGDGNFNHFLAISEQLCCSAVTLVPETAVADIDRVITDVLYYKKPGYIALPTDLADMPVKPPTAKLRYRQAEVNPESLAAFKATVTARLGAAQKPAVLVGHLLERYGLTKEANRFFETVHIPFAVATLGKGAVSEHVDNCVGTYIAGSTPGPAKSVIEGADVCVLIGTELTDAVTANFHHKINMANAILVHPFHAKVGDEHFTQVPMAEALKVLEEVCLSFHSRWSTNYPKPETFVPPRDPNKFDNAHFWRELQSSLRPNDMVVVDLGTSAFSSLLLDLPEGAGYVCQNMWAAIGYAVPAALGIQIAEPDRRVIVVVGDGALQMTVQELGTFSRHRLNTTVFLINNDGYTIERFIRGTHAVYNDIAKWDWKTLAKGFCVAAPLSISEIRKPGETTETLRKREGRPADFAFVEVIIDKLDGPLRTPVPLPIQFPH